MSDEPTHYQKAITALAAAEANASNPGVDPATKMPQAQYVATVALTQAVLALVDAVRWLGPTSK